MKKVISLLLVIILVCALGVAATGCKSTENTGDDSNQKFDETIPGGMADVSKEVLEALQNSGEITIYEYNTDGAEGRDEWLADFDEYYSQVYNGTVVRIDVEWEGWEEDYITRFASEEAPDLTYLFEKNWPKLANRGMVYSTDELTDMGVVGLDHPLLTSDLDLVNGIYNYKGKCYTFATYKAEADMIFVNEDLFKQFGVKSPSAYYAEGLWNWDTFLECATELTRDSDGDDVIDIYAYTGWDPNFVITAAGGNLITLDDDGTLTVTMDSIETTKGLQNYNDLYGVRKVAVDGGKFSGGRIGMIAWMPQNEYMPITGTNGYDKYTFDVSMIPYPHDTSTNKADIYSGKSYAWTVSTSTTNQQGVINYMIADRAFRKNNPAPGTHDYTQAFTEEEIQMIEDCTRKAVVPIYQGVGTLWGSQWDFWWNMRGSNVTVSEIVTQFKPMFESQVELENDSATH